MSTHTAENSQMLRRWPEDVRYAQFNAFIPFYWLISTSIFQLLPYLNEIICFGEQPKRETAFEVAFDSR